MPAIFPVASSRVSEQLLRARLLAQFDFDRLQLVRLQDQLSTGIRLTVPGGDPRDHASAAVGTKATSHHQRQHDFLVRRRVRQRTLTCFRFADQRPRKCVDRCQHNK